MPTHGSHASACWTRSDSYGHVALFHGSTLELQRAGRSVQRPHRLDERLASKAFRGRMHVAVHEGESSVDVRAAQTREVLAVIGQQAGLREYFDEAANGIVDAQFSGIALDHGLRRLPRAASLSYILLYTQGTAEAVNLRKVCVFGRCAASQPPTTTEHA